MRENADQNNSEYGYFLRSDRIEGVILGTRTKAEPIFGIKGS